MCVREEEREREREGERERERREGGGTSAGHLGAHLQHLRLLL